MTIEELIKKRRRGARQTQKWTEKPFLAYDEENDDVYDPEEDAKQFQEVWLKWLEKSAYNKYGVKVGKLPAKKKRKKKQPKAQKKPIRRFKFDE